MNLSARPPTLDDLSEKTFCRIRDAISQARNAGWAVFVDPAASERLDELTDIDPHSVRLPLWRIDMDVTNQTRPYLLYVRDGLQREHLLSALSRRAAEEHLEVAYAERSPRSIAGWVVDVANPTALSDSLGRSAVVFKPDKQRHVLRYWDPRVLDQLCRVLPPMQYARLIGRMGQWWTLDRQGAPCRPLEPAVVPAKGDEALHIDNSTWKALERIEHVNEVVRTVRSLAVPIDASLLKETDDAIRRAQNYGFCVEADWHQFAVCALLVHPEFDEHPSVSRKVNEAASSGRRFAEAVAEFDDSFWDAVANTYRPQQRQASTA